MPLEPPKGPGTGLIAGGAVLGGVGLGIMTAALASDGFAPQAWQRAIIVPVSMAAIGGGSALLILGLRRRIQTRRWNERETALVPMLGPGSVGLRGRF